MTASRNGRILTVAVLLTSLTALAVAQDARPASQPVASSFTFAGGITLFIAIVGAGLGIMNTWRAFGRDRVRLRLISRRVVPRPGIDPRIKLCVDITNLSTFPITIKEVGVFYRGSRRRSVNKDPMTLDTGDFPRRLEPRTLFTVCLFQDLLEESKDGCPVKSVYVSTDCGAVAKVSSSPSKKYHLLPRHSS